MPRQKLYILYLPWATSPGTGINQVWGDCNGPTRRTHSPPKHLQYTHISQTTKLPKTIKTLKSPKKPKGYCTHIHFTTHNTYFTQHNLPYTTTIHPIYTNTTHTHIHSEQNYIHYHSLHSHIYPYILHQTLHYTTTHTFYTLHCIAMHPVYP